MWYSFSNMSWLSGTWTTRRAIAMALGSAAIGALGGGALGALYGYSYGMLMGYVVAIYPVSVVLGPDNAIKLSKVSLDIIEQMEKDGK